MNVNMHSRHTGRTCAMLHKAIAQALEGQKVMVVAENYKHALMMLEDTARMERPSGISRAIRRIDYFKGSIVFVVNDPSREYEKGWRGPILTDHYVLENL